MAASVFYIPSVNIIGSDSLSCAMDTMRDYGWRRALIVTDAMLNKLGMAADIQNVLAGRNSHFSPGRRPLLMTPR